MPYTAENVPSYVKKDKAKWAKIWNAAHKTAKGQGKSDEDAEKYAFAVANAKALNEGKNGLDPMGRELRFSCDMRAAGGSGADDPLRLEGYAAKYNTWSQDLGGFIETVKPGAFDNALTQNQDVRALMNHDPNLVLGRTKSGTLRLKSDDTGLFYRVELPDTQVARDLHTSVSRGDIDQCSFAFKVADGGEKWTDERASDGKTRITKRELTNVVLFDVSAVTYPAYLDTNVAARNDLRVWSDVVPAEVRAEVEAREAEDSYEETLSEISTALAESFPNPANEKMDGPYYVGGKYWLVETYSDYVIVSAVGTNDYFKIPYKHDEEAEGEEEITFGDPQPVDKEWVPSGRAQKSIAIYRGSKLAPVTNAGEERKPDPAATRPHMEGVTMPDGKVPNIQNDPGTGTNIPAPSPKYAKALAAAKTAQMYAAVKAAKVAHMTAKTDMEKCGPEPSAQATAAAKLAQAHAAFKQAKADQIAAAEEESKLRASLPDDVGEEVSGEMEPGECNCAHCRTGLIDRAENDEGDCDDDDCTDPSCPCQNRWSVGGDDAVGGGGPRTAAQEAELRWNDPYFFERADGKKRTKRVGGKDLTSGSFAYVGDPERTETWKLPIHDAAHVRNALARFNQTKGIPANKKAGVYRKIVSAAKKFGIEVSDEKNSLTLKSIPPDEEEQAELRKRAEDLAKRIAS